MSSMLFRVLLLLSLVLANAAAYKVDIFAGLSVPSGLALDADNNLYIADPGTNRIVKISVNGTESSYYASDPLLSTPAAVYVDAKNGQIYIASGTEPRIAVLTQDNTLVRDINTTAVAFFQSMTVDADGYIYAVDYSRTVIKLHPDGTVVPWFGNTTWDRDEPNYVFVAPNGLLYVQLNEHEILQLTRDGKVLQIYSFNHTEYAQQYMTVDAAGNIYYLAPNNQIIKLDTKGDVIFIYKQNIPDSVGGLAVDIAGNLYVSASDLNHVRKFATNGTLLSIIAPSVPFTDFNVAVAVHNGKLYVADSGYNRILQLSATNGSLLHIFSDSVSPYSPIDVKLDSAGNIYVVDMTGDRQLIKFSPDGIRLIEYKTLVSSHPTCVAIDTDGNVYAGSSYYITKFAPNGTLLYYFYNENLSAMGIAIDKNGLIYITNYEYTTGHILIFTNNGSLINSINVENAALMRGLALDHQGNMYVGNEQTLQVIKIAPNGKQLATYPDRGIILFAPSGVAVDHYGNVYVANRQSIVKFNITSSKPVAINAVNSVSTA